MKKDKLNKNLAAITTIEVILSMTIFTMIASGIVTALMYGIQSTAISSSSISANYLAEEQLELVTNISHSNYNLLSEGEYHVAVSFYGSLELVAGEEQIGQFTRKVIIVAGADANTKVITSEVLWDDISGQRRISLVRYLTNWKRVGVAVGTPTPTPTPGAASYLVTYDVYDNWGSGFNADVTITNTGTVDVEDWILEWTFTGDQTINGAWDVVENQSGVDVTMTNESWNSVISSNGGSETINVYADNDGSHYAPIRESFMVNGEVATVTYIGISEFAPPPPIGYCHVEAATTYSWGNFNTDIVITNISPSYISVWELEWSFDDKKEKISSLWDADWDQNKQDVSAKSLPYNQNISPSGGTVDFGYWGTYKNIVTILESTNFTLNGIQCE